MSPPGDRREPPADTKCPPAAQRKQAKRACEYEHNRECLGTYCNAVGPSLSNTLIIRKLIRNCTLSQLACDRIN